MQYQGITALIEILRPEIDLSKRRLETLCLIVVGMVSARRTTSMRPSNPPPPSAIVVSF